MPGIARSYSVRKLFFVFPCPHRLHVRDLRPGVAEIGDHTSEVRILLVGGTKLLYDLAVVEAETCEVGDQDGVRRQARHEPVVEATDPGHEPRLTTADLDPDHDLEALAPFGDELRDELRRVLEVGDDPENGVAPCREKCVIRRLDLAEVARVDDDPDAVVSGCELAQDVHRPVRRGVVDEEMVVIEVRDSGHLGLYGLVELPDVPFLVVTRGQDGQQLHCGSFRPSGVGYPWMRP